MSVSIKYAADSAVDGSAARELYTVDGTGERIGIISDSFNYRGGYASDVQKGYLPADVTIVTEGVPNPDPDAHPLTDEGRAMAEIAYETAPGAKLYFAAVGPDIASFAAAVQALEKDGCKIIVDDVRDENEPFFGQTDTLNGTITDFLNGSLNGNYFSAAGNDGNAYYQASFNPITVSASAIDPAGGMGLVTAMDFGSGKYFEYLTVANGAKINLDLQWQQPFPASDGTGGSQYSLSIYLYDSSGKIVASSTSNQLGKEPVQTLSWKDPGTSAGTTSYHIAIVAHGGAIVSPGTFRFTFIGGGNSVSINDPTAGQGSGDIFGHDTLAGVNAVGAANISKTPSQGTSPPVVEPYSEVGQVSFVAPDGSQTSVISGVPNVSFMPFNGTSAAAPVAAAVAALLLQATSSPGQASSLTNSQVTRYLEESAVPMDAANTGFGLLQADTAVGLALGKFQITTELQLDGALRGISLDSKNQSENYSISVNNSLSLTKQIPSLLLANSSSVELDGNGYTLDLGGMGLNLSDGTITLAGVSLTNGGSVSLKNQGVNLVDSQVSLGSLSGFGTYTIDPRSHLSISGQVFSGSTVTFGSAGGVLTLSDSGQFGGEIANFNQGDTIDLTDIGTATDATLDAGNILTVETGGATVTLDLDPSQNYDGYGVIVAPDGNGGADLTLQPEIKVPKDQVVSPSQAAAGSGATIAFGGNPGTVVIPNTQTFNDTITNFQAGDIIQLPNLNSPFPTLVVDRPHQALLIENYPGPFYNQSFEIKLGSFNNYYDQYGVTDPQNYDFLLQQDGSKYIITTTEMLQSISCYLAGTEIAVVGCSMLIERLGVGGLVLTLSGRVQAIKWLGHRSIDCRRHPNPQQVWPVRIQAGAFGHGMPTRDLFLSPDHAVFSKGMLIPIKHLINGVTIVQEPRDEVTYWHVELDQHDVILAEGLPCESYLDTGNRNAFANSGPAIKLHPDFARSAEAAWSQDACAPLVEDGPILAVVRAQLAMCAEAIGQPASRLAEIVLAGTGRTTATLPADVETIRLVSSAGRRGEDRRRLGALITSLWLDGVSLGLDDIRLGFGFHEVEVHGVAKVRWTDGAATIGIGRAAADRVVQIDVAAVTAALDQRAA